MFTETYPIAAGVLHDQRRSLTVWGSAMAGITVMYVSIFPVMGGIEIESLVASFPDALVEALGYNQIGTASGYISSTVFGLLAPIVLAVFSIGVGARLIAGNEEDGTLELELTSPISRRAVYLQRLGALWVDIVLLVAVVSAVTWAMVVGLSLDVAFSNLVAASFGLGLLVLGFGTIALAVGAATGSRAVAMGVAAGVTVVGFMFDAIGPTVNAGWMTATSPFSWYLGNNPLSQGFDLVGTVLLAVLPLVVGAIGLIGFGRRDLTV